MESEKVLIDEFNAAFAARFFLTGEEKCILDTFCLTVNTYSKELAKNNNGIVTVELGTQALNEISLENQEGWEIFDMYRKIALSAMDPENKPPKV